MKYSSHKILCSILIITTILSTAPIFSFAWEHPTAASYCVEIYEDQDYTYSGSITDPHVYFEGRNTSTTKSLRFQPQNKATGTWETEMTYTVSAGGILYKTDSEHTSSNVQHRLKLSNTALNHGVTGYAWVW